MKNTDIPALMRMARLVADLTQKQVAERLGVSASAVTQWETGASTPELHRLLELEEALGLKRGAFIFGEEDRAELERVATAANRKIVWESPLKKPRRPRKAEQPAQIPIYSIPQGLFDKKGIDFENPIEMYSCPPHLAGVENAFGVWIASENMEPRYFRDEIAFVHPGRPVQAGDFIVVQMKTGEGMVMRLKEQTEPAVKLEQLNPPQIIEVPRDQVKAIFKIQGTAPGR